MNKGQGILACQVNPTVTTDEEELKGCTNQHDSN